MHANNETQPSLHRELFTAALTLISLTLIVLVDSPRSTVSVLHTAYGLAVIMAIDAAICLYFWWDFVDRLRRAANRRAFVAAHWLEMLGAIPLALHLRYLLLLRLARLLRFIRLGITWVRTWRIWSDALTTSPHRALGTAALLLAALGSLGFYHAEVGINPRVQSWWDAVWWAVVSAFTVGYGDIVPVTPAGRFIALAVFIVGIALVGSFTAAIAGEVLRGPVRGGADLEDIARKLQRIEQLVLEQQRLLAQSGRHTPAP